MSSPRRAVPTGCSGKCEGGKECVSVKVADGSG